MISLRVDSAVVRDLTTGSEGMVDRRELTISLDDFEERLFYRMEVQAGP